MRRRYILLLVAVQIMVAVQAFGATIIPQTNITEPTTWPRSGNPYTITGLVTVDSGASLTIEAGVAISFDKESEPQFAGIGVQHGAFLYANGQPADSIYFMGDGRLRNGFIVAYGYLGLSYCKFENMNGNSADGNGGSLFFAGTDSSIIDHCTFANNTTPGSTGGAISVRHFSSRPGHLNINNSYFYKNHVNTSGYGGAIGITMETFVNIIGCIFDSNYVANQGGGGAISFVFPSGGSVRNNIFKFNSAYEGGAFYNQGGILDSFPVSGNLFCGNIGVNGGAIRADNSGSFNIYNNTIVGNSANNCGGVYMMMTQPNAKNNILWDNSAALNPQASVSFLNLSSFSCIMEYSDSSRGVIDIDPLFVNTEAFNYHLIRNSLCIDAGDTLSPLDPDYTRADIGAFYFHQNQGSGDANNNCTLSGQDVTFLIRYLKGIGIEPPIKWKADANGSCSVSGSDVTFLINYFKGKNTCPTKNTSCEWTPPPPPDPCSW